MDSILPLTTTPTTMTTAATNPFGARATLRYGDESAVIYRLPELARQGVANLDRLPFSIRVLLENALRHLSLIHISEPTRH